MLASYLNTPWGMLEYWFRQQELDQAAWAAGKVTLCRGLGCAAAAAAARRGTCCQGSVGGFGVLDSYLNTPWGMHEDWLKQ